MRGCNNCIHYDRDGCQSNWECVKKGDHMVWHCDYEERPQMTWNRCHPDRPGNYLVRTEDGETKLVRWHGGWNCELDEQTGEIYRRNEYFDVVEWAELPGGGN